MSMRWMVGAVLVLGWLATPSRAQIFSLGQKPQQDSGSAFDKIDSPLPNPEFCPQHKPQQVDAAEFCSDRAVTPFLPMEDEDRNAFLDYKYPQPCPLLFWVKGEYLNWQVKDGNLAAILVTTTTSDPNATGNFGALDQPDTEVLLGKGPFSFGRLNGGRITGGFSPGNKIPPIEIGGFWLTQTKPLFRAASDGDLDARVLSIPFQASNLFLPGTQQKIPLELASSAGFPGLVAGDLSVNATFDLWGIDANIFLPLLGSDVLFLDCFAGYRYTQLEETLRIRKALQTANPFVLIDFNGDPNGFGEGFRTVTHDQFNAANHFNGGQLGARTGLTVGRLAFLLDAKLALGQNHQVLTVAGSSTLVTPASKLRGASANITIPGGVLALASNSGTFSDNVFSVIPELDVNVGFQLFRSVRLFAGYSLLCWTNVVRPGDQVQNVLDTRQIPTNIEFQSDFVGSAPARRFATSDFWAQGFNFGILIGF